LDGKNKKADKKLLFPPKVSKQENPSPFRIMKIRGNRKEPIINTNTDKAQSSVRAREIKKPAQYSGQEVSLLLKQVHGSDVLPAKR